MGKISIYFKQVRGRLAEHKRLQIKNHRMVIGKMGFDL